jgi:hypothetical protein
MRKNLLLLIITVLRFISSTAQCRFEATRGYIMKFIIKEVQSLQSDREGVEFEGTLIQAKRSATRNQAFRGTVLKIETVSGELVAYKNGVWSDRH